MAFIVTGEAMRPASPYVECFYCHQPVGQEHRPDCVLIVKKVKVQMVVEYEVRVPHSWDAKQINFHRNDSSWCAGNAVDELVELAGEHNECLCEYIRFECLSDEGEPYLDE